MLAITAIIKKTTTDKQNKNTHTQQHITPFALQILIESAYMFVVGTKDIVVLQVEFTARLTLRWRPAYVQDICGL